MGIIEDLADKALEVTGDHRLVLLVDGGSGAGKSTLARELLTHLRRRPTPDAAHHDAAPHDAPPRSSLARTQLVSLDDCYPGWQGLAAGAAMIPAMLRDENPGHPTWDWVANRTSGWIDLDPTAGIIIEGCGALTPQNRQLASAGVWVELDTGTRKLQALDRDGEGYRPWWDLWAAQERAHWQQHRPQRLADIVVDFTSGRPRLR